MDVTIAVTHQSARLVVVQVHSGSRVLAILQRVHELFGDLLAKVYVITAATPDPPFTT